MVEQKGKGQQQYVFGKERDSKPKNKDGGSDNNSPAKEGTNTNTKKDAAAEEYKEDFEA